MRKDASRSESRSRHVGTNLRLLQCGHGGNETGVGPHKKPTPCGRGRGALRAAEAEAQAEASRALIAICGKPHTEAVSAPFETDTA